MAKGKPHFVVNQTLADPLRVEVRAGAGILDPLCSLLDSLSEAHDSAMEQEGGMTDHRKQEPDCSYCAAIRDGERLYNALTRGTK